MFTRHPVMATVIAAALLAVLTVPALAQDDVADKLGGLNWNTNEGKSIDNAARGLALRVWENQGYDEGRHDIYITWPAPEQEYVAVDVYYAWRNFPVPRMTKGDAYFDAEYLNAIFNNETAQTKRARVEGDAAKGEGLLVDRWTKNGVVDFYYIKVVGVLADGSFVDVKEVCAASRTRREDPRFPHLTSTPDDSECTEISRPKGNRQLMTRWEPYGTDWADGHKPPLPDRQVANASAPVEEKMGVLIWATNEGKYQDEGKGTVLRVWNNTGFRRGDKDLFIKVDKQEGEYTAKYYDLYFAWRNFPEPRYTLGNKYFDAEYMKAVFNNEAAQAKRVRLDAAKVHESGWIVDSITANGPIEYYYIKLVGVTEDGRFFDVRGYSNGSAAERAKEEFKLEPAPNDPSKCVGFERPDGDRNLITRWEPYGDAYAPGHEPPAPIRIYPPGDAQTVDKITALNWETNGGKMDDQGKGTVLRVWDNDGGGHGNVDVFVTWDPEQGHQFTHLDIYFAWRNFAVPRFTPASRHYDPEYVMALFNNETAQSKRLRVPYPEGHALLDRTGTNGELKYYYIKVVGVTESGQFIDITNWAVGSKARREDPRWELPAAPDASQALAFERPKGSRNLMTKWEVYGTEWAPGHEPPKVERVYPGGDADLITRMGGLEWDTNEGRSASDGKATTLRNWEMQPKGAVDIIFTWEPVAEKYDVVKYHVFFAWRNFPPVQFENGGRYFNPERMKATWENETAQSKHLTINASDVPNRCFKIIGTAGKPHTFYYAKLAAETSDGQLIDVEDWAIGSAGYRADARWDLPAAPDGEVPTIEYPRGDRNLMTKWEPYGTDWAPGHEPARPMRTYPPGNSPIEVKLGGLNWDTHGGKAMDEGNGTALRNWEMDAKGNVAIYFMWEEQRREYVKIHVFWAWRNFPPPRMTNGAAHYDADYLKAIWANETAQSKHLEIDASKVPDRVFLDQRRPQKWYYAKLVGETEDGTLFDIEDWSIGSRQYRADPRWELPAAPSGSVPSVQRPNGDRNLKTRWEAYGDKWAEGHEPAGPIRIYPPGDADIVTKLGALDWSVNGGKALDDGKGIGIRNWEQGRRGRVNIVFMWDPQDTEITKIHVFWAWRNFPEPRMKTGERHFDAEYLKAIWENETAQTKHAVIDVADCPDNCFIDTGMAGREINWYYAKLVGETADGQLVDIVGWSAASPEYRQKNRLPAVPAGVAKAKVIQRPAGDRNLKTKWEAYGNAWAPGHDPNK